MNTKITFRALLIMSAVFAAACGKDGNPPTGGTAIADDFFVSGKGLRKIWGMESVGSGLGGFLVNDLSLTADGYLHTIFSYGVGGVNGSPAQYANYRIKISVPNGDTAATPGIPSALRSVVLGTITVGCQSFSLVPYTDVLAYAGGNVIAGTPNWQSVPMPPTGGFSAVYASRDAACFSTYPSSGPMRIIASYSVGGIASPAGEKLIGDNSVAASLELTPAGVPLTFVIGRNDSLSVYNYSTGARLSSVRVPMISQYIPAGVVPGYRPDVYIVTKRNRAGTKIIGLINNGTVRAHVCSTFIYDIALNTLTVRVLAAPLENVNLFLGPNVTFDDEGNVYYFTGGSQTQINRITPTGGDVVYRSGFIGGARAGQLLALKHIDDKLFAVIGSPGSSGFSDSRGKGRLLFTVAE